MTERNNIPKHWQKTTLGEILAISSGNGLTKTKRNDDGEYLVYGGNGITGKHSEFLFEEEKLIIGRVGVHCGNAYITKPKSWVTDNAFVVSFDEKIINRNFLLNLIGILRLNKYSVSTAQPVISQGKLYPIEVAIPPLPEQHAIVSKIEELLSELDKGKQQLETAQQQLKLYRQSLLKWAFEGKLTEDWRDKNRKIKPSIDYLAEVSEARKSKYLLAKKNKEKRIEANYDFEYEQSDVIKSWAKGKLDKLIYIAGRIGWRGLTKDEYKIAGPMFLSVHSLNYGKYVEFKDAYHISKERYLESPEIILKEQDILLCKDGAGIGKIGIVNNLQSEATVNSSLLIIRGLEIFIPEFLYYLLSGPSLQTIVRERITGSATPHLFQNDIRKFELLIPPLEEQKQIVQEIESRLSVCDKVEETITTSLAQAETLRQSILKKAFEGKLIK